MKIISHIINFLTGRHDWHTANFQGQVVSRRWTGSGWQYREPTADETRGFLYDQAIK